MTRTFTILSLIPTALDHNWKYHVNKRDGDELYNLANDPNETTNVINGHPEKAATLLKAIKAWDKSLPPLPKRPTPSKRKAKNDAERPKPVASKQRTSGNPTRKRGKNTPTNPSLTRRVSKKQTAASSISDSAATRAHRKESTRTVSISMARRDPGRKNKTAPSMWIQTSCGSSPARRMV